MLRVYKAWLHCLLANEHNEGIVTDGKRIAKGLGFFAVCVCLYVLGGGAEKASYFLAKFVSDILANAAMTFCRSYICKIILY